MDNKDPYLEELCNFVGCYQDNYISNLSPTVLMQNRIDLPRKLFLENKWASSLRVELFEQDPEFISTTTAISSLSWLTNATITTNIPAWSTAKIYQTRESYTGPIYYKIFDANRNILYLENVIRSYPIKYSKKYKKHNWEKRLTTTQIKSIYYPYDYGYYASFP